jgi:hypothetical protein
LFRHSRETIPLRNSEDYIVTPAKAGVQGTLVQRWAKRPPTPAFEHVKESAILFVIPAKAGIHR